MENTLPAEPKQQTYPDLPASPIMMEVNYGLHCMIVIDDEIILRYPLPEGKSQKDLMKHIMTFFLDE